MNSFVESGMIFGPFPDEKIFRIEQSRMQQACTGVKTVEFIWHRKKNVLCFVEAKSSSPINPTQKKDDAPSFSEEIYTKYRDSVELFMVGLLERRAGHDEIPFDIKNANFKKIQFKFVLILKGHEREDLLAALQMDLERRLSALKSIWGAQILVLNEQMAREEHYIS